jgi:MFS family permease
MTANLMITVGISLLLSVYPAGLLSDKLGRQPLIVLSGAIGIFGLLVLYFSPTYFGVLVCGALLGIATGSFLSTNWALATDLALSGEEARYLGLTNLATAGAGALSRLAGPMIDFLNSRHVDLGYSTMLVLCITYFIIGSVLVMLIRRVSSNVTD